MTSDYPEEVKVEIKKLNFKICKMYMFFCSSTSVSVSLNNNKNISIYFITATLC